MAKVALGYRKAPYQAISSGLLSASGIVYTGPALLVSVILYPAAADCTAVVDDSTGGTGTVLAKAAAKADDIVPSGETHIFCPADVGLYLTLAGEGAEALVRYVPLPNDE